MKEKQVKIYLEDFDRINPGTYSQPSQTSNMELFVKTVNCRKQLTIFAKSSLLDVLLGCEYDSETHCACCERIIKFSFG